MTDITTKKSATNTKGNDFNIAQVLGALLDHRWLIIGVVTLFAVFGIIYSLFTTPVYQADSLVQVEKKPGGSLLDNLSQMIPNSQAESTTEIELIKSRMIIGKAVDDLGLDVSVERKFFPVFGKGWARLTGSKPQEIEVPRLLVPEILFGEELTLTVLDDQSFSLSDDDGEILKGKFGDLAFGQGVTVVVNNISAKAGATYYITKKTRLAAINSVLKSLVVTDRGKKTGVLELTLTGESKALVQKTLNSIDENYVLQNVARKSEEAEKSLEFLKEQLPAVRSSLDDAEDKLNSYRKKNDSVDLSLEAKSVLDSIVAVESQLNELTFKEAEISKLFTKEHPAYRALMEKRSTLEKERAKLNKRVATMPQTQQEILRLTRDVDAGKVIYMQLLNKQQELSITKASTVGNVRIVDDAVAQPRPVKPRKTLIVLIAIFLGGLLSVAFVVIKMRMHRGIESPDQLEQEGFNVYASIPLSEWQQKKDLQIRLASRRKVNADSDSLLANGNPADLAIEAIRSLRTSLHFAMMEAKNNVLMISGASPNIGKTFVSINLAAVIAQSGQKVLVIDADMRKGYLHSLLGIDGGNGLSDVLAQQVSIENAIKKTNVEGMDIIVRGQVPPNPSELLMTRGLGELIDWASQNYDMVLVDTPPILAVTDAAIIGHHAGTALMIARFGVNTVKEVEVSIRRFEQNGTNIKGVILNAVEKKASSYYGGYGYYHYEYESTKK
ncbi:TPA: tyrosine-protein kinase Wzc [Serratia marcescens]|uniref:tyrosine-protein kinase Wzc n=1 Tax=Serratia TaxID=613 RepID=UPI0007450A7A|nr:MULTISPECIES: tyrosine-protein kinase Wzc [Serratia]ELY1861334.1 tyrosine-protein kinase Wzc [Serratia marcescens]MEC5626454.1 tyrosine-protein kinase Wzc [Serratia nevei]MEC6067899.1 tyrosine-protein kinase Wzc [Serratia nevei]CVE49225.1 Tyrosine-protein kinase wzc [Serratia marcescens]CVG05317.1 Tyrosine-protein kinase wzc [Serratia marcescens]